jgi:hypothetical protein
MRFVCGVSRRGVGCRFATKVDDPAVWSTLGHHQLAKGMVNDCIGSYLLAKVRAAPRDMCLAPTRPSHVAKTTGDSESMLEISHILFQLIPLNFFACAC